MELKIDKKEEFLDTLLNYYTERGFGVVSKRDIDILMMHLLLKHSDFKKLSNHELSLKLKITEVKIKNLVHEAKLRFYQLNDDDIRSEFIDIIEKSTIEIFSHKVTLNVDDTYLRMALQERVKNLGYVYDSSSEEGNFLMSTDAFSALLGTFYNKDEINEFMKKVSIHSEYKELEFKDLINIFIEEAAKTSAQEGVKLIASSLTGVGLVKKVYGFLEEHILETV